MNLVQKLLIRANEASKALGISRSTLGAKMVNDGNLLDRLEAGGGITTHNYERCMAWLDANLPSDAMPSTTVAKKPQTQVKVL